jgi:hypothetical protein
MDADLIPVPASELADALSYALRYRGGGRKRAHDADEYMAAIAARRLVEHLDRCGFVIVRRSVEHAGHVAKGRLLDERGEG